MVQAILEGRKTMTRRIVNPQIRNGVTLQFHPDGYYLQRSDVTGLFDNNDLKCKYGQPGDVLWVRETHMYVGKPNIEYIFKCGYPANLHPDIVNIPSSRCIAWKPSIHMPKDAARIWLQIEEIRVERLQDITEDDAIAEGVEKVSSDHPNAEQYPYKCYLDDVNSISNAKYSFCSL